MIRPVLDQESVGRGRWRLRDVRVPIAFAGEFDPQPVGCHLRTPQCPDGRHTWDVIEAVTQERWVRDPHSTQDPQDPDGDFIGCQSFRMRFTCITCGRVEHREGKFHETRAPSTHVDPVPLKAGALRAQMIDPGSWSLGRDRDSSTWMVHDATGAVVGLITAQLGRRGAVRHTGRLHAWAPERESVRGASPKAVLRALTRAHTTADVESDAATEVTAATGGSTAMDATRATRTATTSSSQGGAR